MLIGPTLSLSHFILFYSKILFTYIPSMFYDSSIKFVST
jgi:hypothetical protein